MAKSAMSVWSPKDDTDAVYLNDVCGTDSGQVIVIGAVGQAPSSIYLSYDGRSFETYEQATDAPIPAACAANGTEIVSVDMEGTDLRRFQVDGMRYIDLECPQSDCAIPFNSGAPAIWLAAAGHGVVVADSIVHFDATARLAEYAVQGTLLDIHGHSPREIVAVGKKGIAVHFDGKQWRPKATGVTHDLIAVWSLPENAFAVGDRGSLLHYHATHRESRNP